MYHHTNTTKSIDYIHSRLLMFEHLGCVRFLDGVEWNGTIPFHCHGTVPSLCLVWTKNYHGTVPFLCSVLEWDENGMEWNYSKLD
jgi:hypothetical protein